MSLHSRPRQCPAQLLQQVPSQHCFTSAIQVHLQLGHKAVLLQRSCVAIGSSSGLGKTTDQQPTLRLFRLDPLTPGLYFMLFLLAEQRSDQPGNRPASLTAAHTAGSGVTKGFIAPVSVIGICCISRCIRPGRSSAKEATFNGLPCNWPADVLVLMALAQMTQDQPC